MCGICGIINFSDALPEVDVKSLTRMAGTMGHRGPDASGVWISPDRRIGLAHARLSILDLSPSGNQPLANETGDIRIVCNGEIYNHRQIRRELEERGHRYHSRTDTETIIHAYEEWGIGCLEKLEGMFAFALWDGRRKLLFLVRDRMGIKPLYFTRRGSRLFFASEIKAILTCPGVRKEADWEAISHYLTFSAIPAPATAFSGINKLDPAELLSFNREGKSTRKLWWDIFPGTRKLRSEIESEKKDDRENLCLSRLRDLLKNSVAARLMADLPVGVFLSGGIDSSTNVALMAQALDQPVRTFSMAIEGGRAGDELKYARQVADRYGTRHHEIIIREKDWLDFLPALAFHQDELLSDLVCGPLFYLAELARKENTVVVQMGEGADELFFGYDGFVRFYQRHRVFWKRYIHLPRLVRKGSASAFNLISRNQARRESFRRAGFGEELFWGGAIVFTEPEKKRLLRPGACPETDSHRVIKEILNDFDRHLGWDDCVARMTYLELKFRLPELLLMRADRMCMAHGVEGRVPYLDHRLVEFALALPPDLKVRNGTGKYIFKKAAEGLLPPEIIWRPKVPFGGGSEELFSPGLLNFSRDLLLNSPLSRKLFRLDYLKELFRRQPVTPAQTNPKIWNLLCLNLWHRKWIEGKDI